jgi:hypothetical protein
LKIVQKNPKKVLTWSVKFEMLSAHTKQLNKNMRTKSIILGAALLAAGVATSMAQVSNVFSVNVVGYVNLNVTSNKYTLMQNPLDDGKGNIVTNIMPLNDSFDTADTGANTGVQSVLLGFDNTGHLVALETYFAGFGWFPGTNAFPPGRGFFFYGGTNAPVTLAGNVVTNSSKTLTSGYNLVGSAYPAALDITTLGLTGTNNVVNGNNDVILRQDPVAFTLSDIVTFFGPTSPPATPAYGWFENMNDQGPQGPTARVGEAFYYFIAPGNTSFGWNQNFTIH